MMEKQFKVNFFGSKLERLGFFCSNFGYKE